MIKKILIICTGLALGLGAGCGDKVTEPETPPPVAAADLPTQIQAAFSSADTQLKGMADQAVKAFQAGNWPLSLGTFNKMLTRTDLTEEQYTLASRCIMTVNAKLQAAQANGDQRAQKFLQQQEISK
ncbi:MAG TPA: hypothetical protein EYQ50_00010 [Verrucomicrobiales bacterium]|nr:hypothetical protein [Verrucomicrobiales bacterium]HIL70481.1 hypothetical protein [Verrucomicrobiota bacterium]